MNPLVSFSGSSEYRLPLSSPVVAAVQNLIKDGGLSPSVIIESAWAILVHRYSGEDDVVFGVCREHEVAGEWMDDTTRLRVRLSGAMTVSAALDAVKQSAAGRDPEAAPLPAGVLLFKSSVDFTSSRGSKRDAAPSQITISADSEWTLKAIYDSDSFDASAIAQILGHLGSVIEAMAADPHQPISTLPLLTPAERRQLITDWNSTRAGYPKQCAHELFEEQAARTPRAVALSFEERQIKYGELNDMADAVARHLRELGVGPEVIVAICMERSTAMVAGLLGILKAGGAYLPLDPSYPDERLAFMLQDSKAAVLITETRLDERFSASGVRVLYYDGQTIRKRAGMDSAPGINASIARPDNLAYVIYTSGSTGQPKGVQIPHSALVNFLTSMRVQPGLTAGDVLLAVTTISFDIAALEIFLPLIAGARVVLAGRELAANATLLAEKIGACGATVMQATPATWRLLVESGWRPPPALKLFCGGEALSRDLADRLLENGASVWNLYGPTETTIWSTIHRVEPGRGAVTIGRPIANTQIYILDRQMQLAPIGVPGELCIGGDGLARGYLNRPELTASRFVSNPFDGSASSRLYKTGDRAVYRRDGNIEFHGRIDRQVKIRGFRIELEEIESVLLRHPSISQAVVAATQDTGEGRQLIAYLVLRPNPKATGGELRGFLKGKLPDYMVPSTFFLLDSFPLTPNGKVDRGALSAPGAEGLRTLRSLDLEETFVPPANGIQADLIRIWEEALDVNPIGIHENFFDLGGHSLLAAAVSREVAKRFGKQISLATIFRWPTVEELAIALSNGKDGGEGSPLDEIRVTGSRTPFFCMPGLFDLARYLGPDQPCYGLNLPQFGDAPDKWPSVEEIAAGSIQTIRAVRPNGPYCVGGYSFGGVVAFEIARQLEALGEEISLLILIDPDPPRPFRTRGFDFYLSRILFHGHKLAGLSPRNQFKYFADRLRKRRSPNLSSLWNIGYSDAQLAAYLVQTETVHARYQISPFGGQARMFLAQDTIWRVRPEKDPRLSWSNVVGGKLETYETPGNHASLIREPNVRALAQRLSLCLEKAGSVIALLLCMAAVWR